MNRNTITRAITTASAAVLGICLCSNGTWPTPAQAITDSSGRAASSSTAPDVADAVVARKVQMADAHVRDAALRAAYLAPVRAVRQAACVG
jgi:hypothetical protein